MPTHPTQSEPQTPFGVVIGQRAESAPGAPALTCDEVTITRAELETRTNRLARVYQTLGVAPDSLVTIGLPNGIGFFEATIAAWKLGATPLRGDDGKVRRSALRAARLPPRG